jgi:HPr serine kinase-like protein
MMKSKPLAHDPILCDFELPLAAVYHPFGFSLEVLTNSRAVLSAAEQSWGMLREHFHQRPARLYVGVLEGNSKECPPAPVVRGRRNLMSLTADAENFALLDLREGFGYCWLNRAAAENTGYVRYHFLESTGPTLLEYMYTTPLHAACVEFNGHGVLLCGDSGAGKSSLAYACARRGWTFLADDASCIVRARKGRIVIGNPYSMRFRESATNLFPELRERPVTTRATGKLAIELTTDSLPGIKIGRETEIDHIVFLDRHSADPPWLSSYPLADARKSFERVICYGEEENREAQRTALHNLLTAEILEMHYGDLEWAVDRLEVMVKQSAERHRAPLLLS